MRATPWILGRGVAALLALAGPAPALADVVRPPPAACTAGSIGRTGHSGPHCAPRSCERGCEDGLACRPTELCIVQRQGANRVRRFTFEVVAGACLADRKCAQGVCEVREVCVPAAAPPAGPDASLEPVTATAPTTEPVPVASGPDAQTPDDKKPGTETRKPAACSVGAGEGGWALALALAASLVVLALRRRGRAV